MSKPILCLDFDGVCHSYTSGWKGATVIPDPPVPGLFEFLEQASEHFEIHVFSSRSHEPGGTEAMDEWFSRRWLAWRIDTRVRGDETPSDWTPGSIHFPQYKPSAQITLDDRALTFRGAWPSVDTLRTFKPWNKGGRSDV